MKSYVFRKRRGFSLMELLAVVTILGIIAAIIVPRVTVSSDTAKAKVNAHNKATINAELKDLGYTKSLSEFTSATETRETMRAELLKALQAKGVCN